LRLLALGNELISFFNKKANELNFNITKEALDSPSSLPLDYAMWNFFDVIIEGKRNPNSMLLKELNSEEANKIFQQDANIAKLKISLLSDELIKDFVNFYYQILVHFCSQFKDFYDLNELQAQKELLLNEIIGRKEAVKTCGLQQDLFKEFLQNVQTKEMINEFANELKEFKMIQKHHLKIDIDEMLDKQFNDLNLNNDSGIRLNK
jgi:hypothetical protein